MRFEKLGRNRTVRTDVPMLDGGMNRRDDPVQIEDSQMVQSVNLWWKDRAMRTRPGIQCRAEQVYHPDADATLIRFQYAGEDSGTVDGRRVVIASGYKDGSVFNWTYTPGVLSFDGTLTATAQSVSVDYNPSNGADGHALLVEYDRQELERLTGKRNVDGGLMLLSEGYFYALPSFAYQAPVRMDDYLYRPLVRRAGKGVKERGTNIAITGEAYEEYNLATPYFRSAFTTDGEATAFYLPQTELDDGKLTADLTDGTGHRFVFEIPQGGESSAAQGGMVLHCDRTAGCVYFTDGSGAAKAPSKGAADNLIVTAAKTRKESSRILYEMETAVWYGGNSAFSPGGARLFLTGNPRYPNRVQWSAPGNPLYFPENSFMTVGDAAAVTALAVQGDLLAIFKERELYTAAYTPSRVSAGEAAAFTVEKLRSAVGCDRPETIVLCGNRLVWANSTGSVYTLLSAAKGVGCLSGLIGRDLARASFDGACAAEVDGHYALLLENKAYLLRLDEGYHRYTSVGEDREAESRLKWTVWDFSAAGVTFRTIIGRGGRFALLGYAPGEADGAPLYPVYVRAEGETDTVLASADGPVFAETPVTYVLETKAYPFGDRDTEKRIRSIVLGVEGTEGMRLIFQTERSAQEAAALPLLSGDGRMTIRPGICRGRTLTLRLEGCGAAAMAGLSLQADVYRGR